MRFSTFEEQLLHDIIESYPETKEAIVLNKNVPITILETLADDIEENVRFAIASKRKLNENLFMKLSKDKSPTVRNRLVYNKSIPLSVLKSLSMDEEKFVRSSALAKLKDRHL